MSKDLQESQDKSEVDFTKMMTDYIEPDGRLFLYAKLHGWNDLLHDYQSCFDLKSKENYPVTNQKASEYISFIESTGAKLVCTWGYYAYFRQESKKGNFEIYSDKESKIEYYKRIRKLFISLCFIEMFCSSIEWFCFFNVKAIMFMFLGIFLTTLTVLFFYQASKCNKKINQLNNEL